MSTPTPPKSSTPSPFAARTGTRPPIPPASPAASSPVPAPASAPAPSPTVASTDIDALDNRRGSGRGPAWAAGLAAAVLSVAGLWWWAGGRGGQTPAPAGVAPAVKMQAATENAAERAGRLAKEFELLQGRAADLALDAEARLRMAEATLLGTQARAKMAAGEMAAAEESWARALRTAGPLVLARLEAMERAEAWDLGEVKLDDHPASQAQALARASRAAGEAAARGEWGEALARRDEARALVAPARTAIAEEFAAAARGAMERGDEAMATLFHERALRLVPSLEASRTFLYRHKFNAGQIIRTPGGLEFAYAPPGEFTRGSPVSEPGRDADEAPQRVQLSKGFFIAVNETTQADWDRVFGAGEAARMLRAARARAEEIAPELPMHSVTWEQAAEYCARLSKLEGMAFRLPTEAEWEYACRAGTSTAFNPGVEGLSARDANIDDDSPAAVLAPRRPGASGRTNAWGLRDMHGNVWEWCADWSAPYPADPAPLRDPEGPARESLGRIDLALKVVRGGGWNAPAKDARSANRWEYSPAVATDYIGLRAVHDPDLAKP